MAERRSDEALAVDDDRAALPASGTARLALHVGHRLGNGCLVRCDDLSRHRRLRDPEEDADALGRAEGQVEAGDRVTSDCTSEQLSSGGVAALEQSHDALLAHLARQPERGCAAALPDARSLALARVVVLAALGDAIDVVAAGTRACSELADVQHPVRPSRRGERAGKAIRTRGERSEPACRMKGMRCRRTLGPRRLEWSARRGANQALRQAVQVCARSCSFFSRSRSGVSLRVPRLVRSTAEGGDARVAPWAARLSPFGNSGYLVRGTLALGRNATLSLSPAKRKRRRVSRQSLLVVRGGRQERRNADDRNHANKPVAGTESCQVRHVGVAQSGRIAVKHEDGTKLEDRRWRGVRHRARTRRVGHRR